MILDNDKPWLCTNSCTFTIHVHYTAGSHWGEMCDKLKEGLLLTEVTRRNTAMPNVEWIKKRLVFQCKSNREENTPELNICHFVHTWPKLHINFISRGYKVWIEEFKDLHNSILIWDLIKYKSKCKARKRKAKMAHLEEKLKTFQELQMRSGPVTRKTNLRFCKPSMIFSMKILHKGQ